MVAIRESYAQANPPSWVRPTVERLLSSLAPEHVAGLDAIVLTDAASIGGGKTQRVAGRKHTRASCLGFYHPAAHTARPWIELLVDNIVARAPRGSLQFQPFRDLMVADALFHELGHHLQHSFGGRGGEATAEAWRRRLTKLHAKRRWWYLRPLRLLIPVLKLLQRKKA